MAGNLHLPHTECREPAIGSSLAADDGPLPSFVPRVTAVGFQRISSTSTPAAIAGVPFIGFVAPPIWGPEVYGASVSEQRAYYEDCGCR